jgi:hypothetical protein
VPSPGRPGWDSREGGLFMQMKSGCSRIMGICNEFVGDDFAGCCDDFQVGDFILGAESGGSLEVEAESVLGDVEKDGDI